MSDSDDPVMLGPVMMVLPSIETDFMTMPDDDTMAEARDALASMPDDLAEALPIKEGPLMRMPNEIIGEISRYLVTPFSDIDPLWQVNPDSDLKAFALVNRRLNAICESLLLLSHVRLWVPESALPECLDELRGERLLSTCRSLSIRTIGPLLDTTSSRAMISQLGYATPEFRDSLRNTILSATNLTELRFATDNGGKSMEAVFSAILKPRDIMFPNIKSLYLRTETNMASTFGCFPNLKAINFNIHCELTRSTELRALTTKTKLRVLSILKHGRGWVVDDLSRHLASRFQRVESLTLEGFINMNGFRYVQLKRMAKRIISWPALKKLVISDEPYIYMPDRIATTPTYFDLARSKTRPRSDVAAVFFRNLPNLREIVIGRKCDFSAHVYYPLIRFPDEADAADDPNWTPEPEMDAKLVHVYSPRDRTNVGYQYVSRPGNCKWGQPYQIGGHQTEYVHMEGINSDRDWYYYPEMKLENCQTTFFDAEWLHTIRAKEF